MDKRKKRTKEQSNEETKEQRKGGLALLTIASSVRVNMTKGESALTQKATTTVLRPP